MIFIYLDWSVLSQLKNGKLPELSLILSKDRFLLPYSTSHIGDLFAGYDGTDEKMKLIKEDLNFISEVSKTFCLSNDGKNVTLQNLDPHELFQQRIDEKDLFEDFSLDSLATTIEESSELGGLGNVYIDLIRNFPIDNALVESLKNPETRKMMDSMLPGWADEPTMEGFFKAFGKMIKGMNEGTGYQDLRKLTQTGLGIKRDQIFNSENPYKLISEVHDKFNLGLNKHNKQGQHAPEWFDKISNEYIQLDMHGYQEDKVSVNKGRKQTFRNTTEDASHAAFASTCNLFIVSDNRARKKAIKVFEKLKIDTIVLSPIEFQQYYSDFFFERPVVDDFEIPIQYIQTNMYMERRNDDGTFLRTYHIPHFSFDFFNKMHVIFDVEGKVDTIALAQLKPTNKPFTYYFEIEKLSEVLYANLGMDAGGFGEIKAEEFEGEWRGRAWIFPNLDFRLIAVNGHFQMYMTSLSKSPEQNATGG
jgi:hypothetical protein